MIEVTFILLGAAMTLLAVQSAGRLLFARLQLADGGGQAIAFGAGAAILSLAVFALCAMQLATVASLVILCVVLIAAGRPRLRLPRMTLWLLPFAAFGVWYFVNALAPEASADGAFYHLTFPARYLRHGGFFPIHTNFYGNFPQGLEMLFLAAFAVGRHSAAALVHLAFLFVLCGAMIAYQPKAGWLAALIVFTSPVIGMDASTAYNDVGCAAIVFLCYAALSRWDDDRRPAWLVVVGLLAGFAFAIKYTAFLVLPYAVGFVLWRSRSARSAVLVCALAAVSIAPWTIKNWLTAGNPVTPFFNRVFPNPYVSIAFEDGYRENMRHFGGAQLEWRTPFDVAVTGRKVQASLGPVFLLLPLALAGLANDREVRRLLFAGVVFALPWFANAGTRFLIPCAPFFALALAITVAKWGRVALPFLAVATCVSAWPRVVAQYTEPGNWRIFSLPVAAAFRQIPETEFLASRIDTYPIIQMIDAYTPSGAVIYTALPMPEAYSERDYVLNYAGALNENLEEIRWTPFRERLQPRTRLLFTVEREATELRLVHACAPPWNIAEVRWEPEGPAALTASAEPWFTHWAHDGNAATRWRPWRSDNRGTSFEIRFPSRRMTRLLQIDTAAAAAADGCLAVEADGVRLSTRAERQAIDPPADLRREAMNAFRAAGISHLLIHKLEAGAADFDEHQNDWGITRLAESGPGILYRIEQPVENVNKQ